MTLPPTMNLHQPAPPLASPRQPYWRVLGSVVVSWVLAMIVASFVLAAGPWAASLAALTSLADALTIAVGSLVVAIVALVPGMMRTAPVGSETTTVPGTLATNLLLGMAIRLFGTVALFLTCRYQLATSPEITAAMTIGWYLLLTIVEVSVLARELPKTATAHQVAETSLG